MSKNESCQWECNRDIRMKRVGIRQGASCMKSRGGLYLKEKNYMSSIIIPQDQYIVNLFCSVSMAACIHVCERKQHWCCRNSHAWSHLLFLSLEPKDMSALKLWGSEQTNAVSASGILMATVRARVWSTLLPSLPEHPWLNCITRPFLPNQESRKEKRMEGMGKEGKKRERRKEREKEKKKQNRKMASFFLSLSSFLIVPPTDIT